MVSAFPKADDADPGLTCSQRSAWIPWLFVGLFLIVLMVNGTMIAIAVSTFNGLETSQAYEKGLAYNQRLAAAEEQAKLGWQASIEVLPNEQGGITLTFDLADHLDEPIVAADVVARLDRPLQEGYDQTVRLEDHGGGRYMTVIGLPYRGQWDIALSADARGHRYQLNKRFYLSP